LPIAAGVSQSPGYATLKYRRRGSAVKKSGGSALLIATRTSDEFLRNVDKARTRAGKRERERGEERESWRMTDRKRATGGWITEKKNAK